MVTTVTRARRFYSVLGGLVATAALVATGAVAANAATSPGTTDAHVAVETAISLTGLTPEFTLTGAPGAVVTQAGAVSYNVQTNNVAGYTVSVQAAAATLAPALPGNTASIPVASLQVGNFADVLTPLSASAPVVVHSQSAASLEAGDALSDDYSITIPFVPADTYTVTLDYIATTL